MDIEMKSEYRSYGIKWVDFHRAFTISLDGIEISKNKSTLEDCQKWIDSKLKEKYNRVDVLCAGWRWGGEVREYAATSLNEESGIFYVCLSDSKNQRSKENINKVYLNNEFNQNLLSDVSAKLVVIKLLEDEAQELMAKMEKLTPDMMIVK